MNNTNLPFSYGGPGGDFFPAWRYEKGVAYCQVFERADWFAGGAQNVTDMDASAAERWAIAQP